MTKRIRALGDVRSADLCVEFCDIVEAFELFGLVIYVSFMLDPCCADVYT
jgi:hypothetical protein